MTNPTRNSLFIFILILSISLTLCSTQKNQIEKINGVNFVSTPYPVDESNFQPIVDINANFVAAIPYSFTRGRTPNVSFNTPSQWYGETVAGTINIIEEAKKKGLKTMIKPHIWVMGDGWAGEFELTNEKDWKKWEAGFDDYILTYAKLADSLDVDVFCMATEFRKVVEKRPQYWDQLILKIRKVYNGKLTYAANWDNYDKVQFWDQLDYIGIDAYFPLKHIATPTVNELVYAWSPVKKLLKDLSDKHKKPLLFTEYGYQSVDFGAGRHWDIDVRNLEPNEITQKNAYEAMYQVFWDEDWVAGGFLWKWFPEHQESGGKQNKRFTPQNKEAQKIISKYYLKHKKN